MLGLGLEQFSSVDPGIQLGLGLGLGSGLGIAPGSCGTGAECLVRSVGGATDWSKGYACGVCYAREHARQAGIVAQSLCHCGKAQKVAKRQGA